jgi:hypothetical protein
VTVNSVVPPTAAILGTDAGVAENEHVEGALGASLIVTLCPAIVTVPDRWLAVELA